MYTKLLLKKNRSQDRIMRGGALEDFVWDAEKSQSGATVVSARAGTTMRLCASGSKGRPLILQIEDINFF